MPADDERTGDAAGGQRADPDQGHVRDAPAHTNEARAPRPQTGMSSHVRIKEFWDRRYRVGKILIEFRVHVFLFMVTWQQQLVSRGMFLRIEWYMPIMHNRQKYTIFHLFFNNLFVSGNFSEESEL